MNEDQIRELWQTHFPRTRITSAWIRFSQALAVAAVEARAKPLDDGTLQRLFGDAIEGALALGYACEDPPPEGHWLQRFWALGNAQSNAERNRLNEERERCAQYLRDAADRLAPEGKRTSQVDRHTAHVLAGKGDELAHGFHMRPNAEAQPKTTARRD